MQEAQEIDNIPRIVEDTEPKARCPVAGTEYEDLFDAMVTELRTAKSRETARDIIHTAEQKAA